MKGQGKGETLVKAINLTSRKEESKLMKFLEDSKRCRRPLGQGCLSWEPREEVFQEEQLWSPICRVVMEDDYREKQWISMIRGTFEKVMEVKV